MSEAIKQKAKKEVSAIIERKAATIIEKVEPLETIKITMRKHKGGSGSVSVSVYLGYNPDLKRSQYLTLGTINIKTMALNERLAAVLTGSERISNEFSKALKEYKNSHVYKVRQAQGLVAEPDSSLNADTSYAYNTPCAQAKRSVKKAEIALKEADVLLGELNEKPDQNCEEALKNLKKALDEADAALEEAEAVLDIDAGEDTKVAVIAVEPSTQDKPKCLWSRLVRMGRAIKENLKDF